jgi:hypothetical protein
VTKRVMLALFVVTMVAIVVSVDVLFFRHRLGERLIVNICIVLAFVLFYFLFLKRR